MRAWLAMLLLLVAATCPQIEVEEFLLQGTTEIIQQSAAVDYQLIIDRSGSMRGEKLAQAKNAAHELVDSMHSRDRASVLTFDSSAQIVEELTNDQEALKQAIDSITAGDFTRYGQAIELATQQFEDKRNVIIFLSDGKPDETQEQINLPLQEALDKQACFFTVAYAQEEDDVGREILAEIARQSQDNSGCGAYFSAEENSFELSYIFRTIYTDVSAKNVFDIEADVRQEEKITIHNKITSSYNQREINTQACFQPELHYLVTSDGEVAYEATTTNLSQQLTLGAGTYNYFITATETCQGECLFTGSTTGSFRVDEQIIACYTPWDQLTTLLNSNDAVNVYITEEGFDPQAVSTEGIITWINNDVRPHKISSIQGAFTSPTLQPGESWTYTLPPGEYSYIDLMGGFNGLLSQEDDQHKAADVIFLIDTSGSMAGAPIAQAKTAIEGIIEAMAPSDRIGLISFNDRARSVAMTGDTRRITSATNSLVAAGPTSYLQALDQLEKIRPQNNQRGMVAIFLSDGIPHDQASQEEIVERATRAIGSGCLYTIGYGNPDPQATQLLTEMALASRERNNCGAYYFSSAEKEELSSVFGEIYASTQNAGLEIFDTTIEVEDNTVSVSTQVRSAINGQMVPSTSNAGCIPQAQVSALVGGQTIPLTYDGGTYTASFDLAPGEYRGFVNAKIQNSESVEQAAVGSKTIELEIESGDSWIYWPIMIGLGLIVYIFIRKQLTKVSEE